MQAAHGIGDLRGGRSHRVVQFSDLAEDFRGLGQLRIQRVPGSIQRPFRSMKTVVQARVLVGAPGHRIERLGHYLVQAERFQQASAQRIGQQDHADRGQQAGHRAAEGQVQRAEQAAA